MVVLDFVLIAARETGTGLRSVVQLPLSMQQ